MNYNPKTHSVEPFEFVGGVYGFISWGRLIRDYLTREANGDITLLRIDRQGISFKIGD